MKEPLIEIDLFNSGTFSSSNLTIFTGQFTKIAIMVFGALYFQEVLKMNPLMAGLALFPAIVPIPFTAFLAGKATDRYGPRLPVLAGLLLAGISLTAMGLTVHSERYLYIAPTLVGWGLSVAWMFAPALVAVMNSVAVEKQGQASGIVLTSQIFGATIGVAVLSALLQVFHDYRVIFLTTGAFTFFTLIISWLFLERRRVPHAK